jgi:fatty acid desaturase
MIFEAAVFLGTMAALVLLDWQKFLLYVLVPHQYAAWGIITMNFLQHDGCDERTQYNHSRNFVGKLVNWWTYNNGYHSIHHDEPGLHWSLLPAEHAKRVAPFIHPNLDQPSLLAYLWRAFFWPAKRERFDGAPYELPAEGPDEEWIPAPQETPRDVSLGAIA